MKVFFLCLVLAASLVLPAAAVAAEPGLSLFVNSSAYIVSVAPVDEESKNAENSILYQRTTADGEWERLGPCRKVTLSNGEVRFTREVEVERDGAYYYTSRPVVGGEVSNAPWPDSPPQAMVIVDTLRPTAEITLPAADFEVLPGDAVDLSWTSVDENLGSLPATLAYTTDGGKSWNLIGRELPAAGDLAWTAPEDVSGPVMVRLSVADLAGNVGSGMRRADAINPAPALAPADTSAKTPEAASADEKDEPSPEEKINDPNRAWLYYLMAVNLMRQNKPADALQYYWLAVKQDSDFIDAWADIGLAYIDLGAYKTAREVLERTRDKAPDRIDLMHLMGETHHAEGMELLGEARSADDRARAKEHIDQAVEWYGKALEQAAKDWRLSEQAPSFYRLGEVCYYVNLDREGARAYWNKILELHSPTPNADLILWAPPTEREKAKRRHQRYTHLRVSLDAWQNWARGYINQMDERERKGILDLMPARQIAARPGPQQLSSGGTYINPGRDDNRSLFSLPARMGSSSPATAGTGYSVPVPPRESRADMMSYAGRTTEDYSFYAPKNGRGQATMTVTPVRGRRQGSVFTGGPDAPPPPNPDPYAFPARSGLAEWNRAGAYGDRPIDTW